MLFATQEKPSGKYCSSVSFLRQVHSFCWLFFRSLLSAAQDSFHRGIQLGIRSDAFISYVQVYNKQQNFSMLITTLVGPSWPTPASLLFSWSPWNFVVQLSVLFRPFWFCIFNTESKQPIISPVIYFSNSWSQFHVFSVPVIFALEKSDTFNPVMSFSHPNCIRRVVNAYQNQVFQVAE